ncbi:MAG: hypothetical protein FWG10_14145 [Eubacteriaceae bacterium]|nr:hypothetical protein [Eubacteriaceae bacterium]
MKKSISKPSKVYLASMAAILLASVYPVYMGIVMLAAYLRDGGINAMDYPKYIIPYTPISIALIVCAAIMPLAYKYLKKYTLPMLSIMAILLFLCSEMALEKITVFSGADNDGNAIAFSETSDDNEDSEFYYFNVVLINESGETETRIVKLNKSETDQKVEMWQWAMCAVPPPNMKEWLQIKIVSESITDGDIIDIQKIPEEQPPEAQLTQKPIAEQRLFKNPYITKYNPVFKMHFYIISIIIDLAVLGVVYGFYEMSHEPQYKKKKPLIVQLISVSIFVGLCVFACFTAFYRTGEITVSPISAVLMAVFFIVFGMTAGVYAGTWLYGKPKLFSMVIPSFIATAATVVMYIGEMVMMDWNLYRFGEGLLFGPVGASPLAPIDFEVILVSGAVTYLVLFLIRPNHETRL